MHQDRQIFEHRDGEIPSHVDLIAEEFRSGFDLVDGIDRPAVTIFGSARVGEDHPAYRQGRAVGRLFAEAGFAVVTGGGGGVMEAANRGCHEVGGLSVGFNIVLPHEQSANGYLDVEYTFDHFYARKVMLVKAAEGFVLFPGGFGTFDEMFEALTLIQTGKVLNFPIVLFDRSYWQGLIDWIKRVPLEHGMISHDDAELLFVTDDPAAAVATIATCYEERCATSPAAPEKEAGE